MTDQYPQGVHVLIPFAHGDAWRNPWLASTVEAQSEDPLQKMSERPQKQTEENRNEFFVFTINTIKKPQWRNILNSFIDFSVAYHGGEAFTVTLTDSRKQEVVVSFYPCWGVDDPSHILEKELFGERAEEVLALGQVEVTMALVPPSTMPAAVLVPGDPWKKFREKLQPKPDESRDPDFDVKDIGPAEEPVVVEKEPPCVCDRPSMGHDSNCEWKAWFDARPRS